MNMQKWEGIVDNSPTPKRIWFGRLKETDAWEPLRKCDCKIINAAVNEGKKKVCIVLLSEGTSNSSIG
jgi:hypothetical protein